MTTQPKKLHTPVSDLLRKRINKIKIKNWNGAGYMIEELEELLPQVEAIETESVENMIEEMPRGIQLMSNREVENDWRALYYVHSEFKEYYGLGDTPQLALKELQKKLLNNK